MAFQNSVWVHASVFFENPILATSSLAFSISCDTQSRREGVFLRYEVKESKSEILPPRISTP